MSLINEALKKAQKLRTAEPAGTVAPATGGGGRVAKRGEPRSTQQLVLLAAGGVVLVVLSVVATFWFVNRTPAAKPAPRPVVVKPADTSAPSPTIVAPAIKPPVVAQETPPAKPTPPPAAAEKPAPTPGAAAPPPAKVAETPAPAAIAPATTQAAPPIAPVATAPPPLESPPDSQPAAVATTSAPATTDPRIHAFVDAIKVMGIRSSGGDSRVLMNDRVFRVNDIVDRNLGLRLTKVEPAMLVFTDSNGAIYTKNF